MASVTTLLFQQTWQSRPTLRCAIEHVVSTEKTGIHIGVTIGKHLTSSAPPRSSKYISSLGAVERRFLRRVQTVYEDDIEAFLDVAESVSEWKNMPR